MANTSAPNSLDIAEQVARVLRSNAETQKFVEEQAKLRAEAAKLDRDRAIAPWQIVATTVAATAALIGGTAAVIKIFFP
ncbi:hypothetical protein [Methylobacterium gossipiicola]|uniref:Uncharacterized protein n=1 Tax=Methylobacterium gossipiicola TaxID=582675 RepID=A0A1I2WTH6_9HYPH|nr:hypothetical protein [Methylobacterium gossipiicola]SFH04634.1 hypothetical protein SAMN05192565_12723 [Methylobacterium gossipiicola]